MTVEAKDSFECDDHMPPDTAQHRAVPKGIHSPAATTSLQ